MSVAKSIMAQMDAEPKYANQSNMWMKMDQGFYTLRFCPPWSDEGTPYRRLDQHQGFLLDGKKIAPFCWDTITSKENISQILADMGTITKDEYEIAAELGCPMCAIATALVKMRRKGDKDDDDYQKFQVKSSYMLNTLMRIPEDKARHNHIFVKSWSQKVFDTVKAQTKAPHLRENLEKGILGVFDRKKGHDFTLSVEGEGFARSYNGLSFAPEETPLGEAKGEIIHDLDKAMAIGVRSYETCVSLCETSHSAIVERSKVNLLKFRPKITNTSKVSKGKTKKK